MNGMNQLNNCYQGLAGMMQQCQPQAPTPWKMGFGVDVRPAGNGGWVVWSPNDRSKPVAAFGALADLLLWLGQQPQ